MSASADAYRALRGDDGAMPYLTNSLMPHGSIEDYRAITAALANDHPEGMIARYVGVSDGGLAISVVWTSKVHADRFETEQLIPTVHALLGPPAPDSGSIFYNYEATDVAFGVEEVSTPSPSGAVQSSN